MKEEYKRALVEVEKIIKMMPKQLQEKIPIKFIKMVENEKSKDYDCEISEPLEEQKLMIETIAILGLIYMEFLCSKEEKIQLRKNEIEILKQIDEENRKKLNKLFDNNKDSNKIIENKELNDDRELILIKEKWYKKIVNIIKKLFNK